MRKTTDLFLINGMPMLLPDADVGMSYEDLDSAESGRDESGVMHRIPVRYKVGAWSFTYHHLTEEENAVYHRGRNAAGAYPKSASVNDYRRATGLEALFGYLHLKGDTERLDTLFGIYVRYLEGESAHADEEK